MIVNTSKRPKSIKTILNAGNGSVTFQLVDNSNEQRIDEFRVEGKKFSEANKAECFVLGVSNTCRDAGAKAQDVSIELKFKAMRERAEYLEQGNVEWARGRTSEGSMLVRALMEHKGWDRDKADKFLAGKTASQKAKFEDHPELKPIIERMRAENAKGVSQETVDKLFAELDEA